MNKILIDFPAKIRGDLAAISESGGVLDAEQCKRICQQLSINIENLMILLLPLAASCSTPTISSFQVGAVACGVKTNSEGWPCLYLGANLEFSGQPLCYSVHAEQSAISNAWSNDEPGVSALAISAPPCGHCRQFLFEIAGKKAFPILLPSANAPEIFKANSGTILAAATDLISTSDAGRIKETGCDLDSNTAELKCDFVCADLSQLLPAAFGPLDLGCELLLMESGAGSNNLKLSDENNDELVALALRAANFSYAPHTLNYAGCALMSGDGKVFSGRYAENAAYNPSLLAFSAALSKMMLSCSETEKSNIERVVLIECPTRSSQRYVTQNLLAAYARDVKLEYHSVRAG